MSLKWRDQAEETLRAKGGGMTSEQIIDFVHYFWRSVHPGIHIKNLAQDTIYTNQVVIINDDHSVGELYTPEAMSQLE
jgi:D-glycerate 3-kinase